MYKNKDNELWDRKRLGKIIEFVKSTSKFGGAFSIKTLAKLPDIGDAAGKTSYLKSGWMIRPDGSITLNTPFSGFIK